MQKLLHPRRTGALGYAELGGDILLLFTIFHVLEHISFFSVCHSCCATRTKTLCEANWQVHFSSTVKAAQLHASTPVPSNGLAWRSVSQWCLCFHRRGRCTTPVFRGVRVFAHAYQHLDFAVYFYLHSFGVPWASNKLSLCWKCARTLFIVQRLKIHCVL